MRAYLKSMWSGKPIIVALATVVVYSAIGFGWFGWGLGFMTTGTAKNLAEKTVMEREAQICAGQFLGGPDAVLNYAAFVKDDDAYKQGQVVEKTKANVMPGDDPNRSRYEVRDLCVAAIKATVKKSGPPKAAVVKN